MAKIEVSGGERRRGGAAGQLKLVRRPMPAVRSRATGRWLVGLGGGERRGRQVGTTMRCAPTLAGGGGTDRPLCRDRHGQRTQARGDAGGRRGREPGDRLLAP